MSKPTFKKQTKPNQKLTNFFPRRESGASSSQPPSSSPPKCAQSSQKSQGSGSTSTINPGQSSKLPQKKLVNAPPKVDQEIISVSSRSSQQSHISISSDSVQIISSSHIGSKPRTLPDTKPYKTFSSNIEDSVIEISSPPAPKRPRTAMVAAEIMSPSRRATRSSVAAPSNVSLKRSRSPSIQHTGASQSASIPLSTLPASAQNPRTPVRRKKIFDTPSDRSPDDSIIMVSKVGSRMQSTVPGVTSISPRSNTKNIIRGPLLLKENISSTCMSPSKRSSKKARFEEDPDAELIPSSQSDEQELSAPRVIKKDPDDVKESVNRWRQGTAPLELPSPIHDDWAMDVDVEVPAPDVDMAYSSDGDPLNITKSVHSSPLQTSEEEVREGLISSANNSTVPTTPASPVPFASTPKTPPRSRTSIVAHAPLPATPVALDSDSKTAQIIAEIKATAMAASASTPDERSELLEYKDLTESSEDDDEDALDIFTFNKLDKGKGKSLHVNNPTSSLEDSFGHSNRYAFRDRAIPSSPSSRGSPIPNDHHVSGRLRIPPLQKAKGPNKPPPKPSTDSKRQKAAYDPLDFLLKEKHIADKRGNGIDALKLAEESMDLKMEDVRMDDGEDNAEEEGEDAGRKQELMDESAAWRAVQEGLRSSSKSSTSPSGSCGPEGRQKDAAVGEDQTKLLAGKNRERMKKILENDRTKLGKVKEAKVLGVPLWESKPRPGDHDAAMVIQSPFPSLPNGHPALRLLGSVWHDAAHAAIVISSGILTGVQVEEYAPLVPFLCDAALFAGDSSAFRILSHVWSTPFPIILKIFHLFASALARMGASPAILKLMGWPASEISTGWSTDADRSATSFRLISILKLASFAGVFPQQDIPDVIMVLLLVAIDPSTSDDITREVIVSVDVVCQSIAGADAVTTETELMICRKVYEFAAALTPINKSYLLSFFSTGRGRTLLIARRLAHALLVGEGVLSSQGLQSNLPPLSSLIQLLTPEPDSGDLFDIQTNADKIDYEDLGYNVDILSVALSGIDEYVTEERRLEAAAPKEGILDSPRKFSKEKPPTQLDIVRNAIEVMHGKIVDIRAAHLDRSRTKAALQRLSMRIYYQRLAAAKSGLGGKPRRILDFFAPSN